MRHTAVALLAIVLAAGCAKEQRKSTGADGGTVVFTTPADATSIFPLFSDDVMAGVLSAQIFDKLAEPGPALNTIGDAGFEPRLAKSWTWAKDSLSIAFAIDPRARWHDGAPVTAKDVRFTWELYHDSSLASPTRPLIAAIDSVTVRDSMTAVFWFARRGPEQFFDATFQMQILPEHALASIPRDALKTSPFGRNPIGSGPFTFVSWESRQSIVLAANTRYYRGRPHLDRVIFSIAPDPQAAVLRLLSGDADFYEYLLPTDIPAVAARPELTLLAYPTLSYTSLIWNERDPKKRSAAHPLFADRALRRALTLAVDRASLVKTVYDSFAVTGHGPVTPNVATYDSTIAMLPYAPDSAKRLLDALGWRASGPDGVRMKNGKPLAFNILVPSSSVPRRKLAVLLQAELKQLGVQVEIDQADFPTVFRRAKDGDFDAVIWTIGLDPSPGNIRQSWSSAAAAPAGSNLGGYRSAVFDAYLDSATHALDPARAKGYFRHVYETIIDDAPAIWISEPMNVAGMSKRVHPTGLRADAWWVNLSGWSIPAAERTARDNAPTAPASPAKP